MRTFLDFLNYRFNEADAPAAPPPPAGGAAGSPPMGGGLGGPPPMGGGLGGPPPMGGGLGGPPPMGGGAGTGSANPATKIKAVSVWSALKKIYGKEDKQKDNKKSNS